MMSANYISQKKDAHRIYCRIVSIHHIVISLRTNILFLYLLLFAKYYILLQPHNAVHFFISLRVEFPGQRMTGYQNLIAWICMSVAFARVSRIKKRRCPIIVGHCAANGIFEREIRGLARCSCNFRALRAAR